MSQNEDDYLRGACSWQWKIKRKDSRLGAEIFSYMKRRDRSFEKNAIIVDVWESVIPPSLQPYCRLDKRVGNALYVQAMPGPYMHQLQMLSDQLLDRIHDLAPRSGIQKIRISPMDRQSKD
ncbi:MAG: DciA family protein [Planctomycetota bacterium]|jgi:hypothetical protein